MLSSPQTDHPLFRGVNACMQCALSFREYDRFAPGKLCHILAVHVAALGWVSCYVLVVDALHQLIFLPYHGESVGCFRTVIVVRTQPINRNVGDIFKTFYKLISGRHGCDICMFGESSSRKRCEKICEPLFTPVLARPLFSLFFRTTPSSRTIRSSPSPRPQKSATRTPTLKRLERRLEAGRTTYHRR